MMRIEENNSVKHFQKEDFDEQLSTNIGLIVYEQEHKH